MSDAQRYFFGQDNSCHWYLVPLEKRAEWMAWCDLPEDDEASWDEPEWAKRIDSYPGHYSFTNPESLL